MTTANPESGDCTATYIVQQAEREYETAPPISSESLAWLRFHGVREAALDGVTECVSGYVRDGQNWTFRINPTDDDNSTAVRLCFHIPVFVDDHFTDLVRFTRKNYNVSHTRHGGRICRAASWLGQSVAPGTGKWAEPTPIWRSPLNWLKAGREGLCYLRMSWPHDRLQPLRDLPAIVGEDAAHSHFIDRATWRDDDKQKPQAWARIRKLPDFADYATKLAERVSKKVVAA